mmetsp:Transcript_24547/g.50966  ORF Transcript_24547/g.50966 Transcript_24547/m.50966 type:complete len:201 (-) Transcript_24547:564-1166(-)
MVVVMTSPRCTTVVRSIIISPSPSSSPSAPSSPEPTRSSSSSTSRRWPAPARRAAGPDMSSASSANSSLLGAGEMRLPPGTMEWVCRWRWRSYLSRSRLRTQHTSRQQQRHSRMASGMSHHSQAQPPVKLMRAGVSLASWPEMPLPPPPLSPPPPPLTMTSWANSSLVSVPLPCTLLMRLDTRLQWYSASAGEDDGMATS